MPLNQNMVIEAAAAAGISEVGIATAAPLNYMRERLEKRVQENRLSPFETKETEKRLSATHLLKNCLSIITLAIPYSPPESALFFDADGPKGTVARCAQALDYHVLAEKKAALLTEHLTLLAGFNFTYRIFCDRSPLLERELAFVSGLGLIGKNCTLINKKYGSYVALCTILLDQAILPTSADKSDPCHNCQLCLEACPAGALVKPYILNPYLCLSYLTQASGVFPRHLRPRLKNIIYGCDLCQEACPHNISAAPSPFAESRFHYFAPQPLLLPLLSITRKEFASTIGLTSAGWRGKTTLQRNAIIALGNSGFKDAVKPIARLLENDPRPVIRLHAAWALSALGGKRAKYYLEKALAGEPHLQVKEEVASGLDELI